MATILVADDDEDIRDVIAQILGRAGFDVLTAADGEEALTIALSTRVDAVLSDIDMPHMDGLQLCAALRADASSADVPVALLSGAFLPSAPVAARVRACRAWSKPMNRTDLVTGLRELVRSGRHGHPARW